MLTSTNKERYRGIVRRLNDDLQGRSFVVLFGVFLASILTATAITNLIVDPYKQYGAGVVPPVVQTSRIDKVESFLAYYTKPTGLILGSSRVQKLDPDHLERMFGHEFFNAGVNFARPEDYLAWIRFYRSTVGAYPKTCIIGLDVAAFNGNLKVDKELFGTKELVCNIPELMNTEARWQQFTELLSFQQSKSSMHAVCRLLQGAKDENRFYRPDGLIVYKTREEEIARNAYDFPSALRYTCDEYERIFRDFQALSFERCRLLQDVVTELSRHQTQVYLFITPNHPELEKVLLASTCYAERERELDALLKNICQLPHVHYRNLATIASFNGTASDFVDGIHPLEANTARMMQVLVNTSREQTAHAIQ